MYPGIQYYVGVVGFLLQWYLICDVRADFIEGLRRGRIDPVSGFVLMWECFWLLVCGCVIYGLVRDIDEEVIDNVVLPHGPVEMIRVNHN